MTTDVPCFDRILGRLSPDGMDGRRAPGSGAGGAEG